jgi:glycosyltransferase involved in cell wall biosynthesis
MEPLLVPWEGNPWRERVRNLARRFTARKACKLSTRVIAVSRFVREFLVERWGIDQSKVGVVYHGVDHPMAPEEPAPSIPKPNIPDRFLFTAGSIRPARGLEDIVHALALLSKQNVRHSLLVAGETDEGMASFKKQMDDLVATLGLSSQIHWLGSLNAGQMNWCFSHCTAFVMSSRAEACPNTALEALRAGCQIVSTKQPPMPEFFEEVAVYYEPRRPEDLADKLQLIIGRSGERADQSREAARRRAEFFTWSKTASDTLAELRKVVAR